MTTFETLPRRIFLDSCTAQTLRDYGSYIYEAEPIEASDRIYRVTDGFANLEALRDIFAVSERAMYAASHDVARTVTKLAESGASRSLAAATASRSLRRRAASTLAAMVSRKYPVGAVTDEWHKTLIVVE
jgi:hypothetical protein